MSQWVSESVSQWVSDSVSQCVSQRVSQGWGLIYVSVSQTDPGMGANIRVSQSVSQSDPGMGNNIRVKSVRPRDGD